MGDADRCAIVALNMTDPAVSASDPKLSALLRDGWTVAAHTPGRRADGASEWLLLLAPPPPLRATAQARERLIAGVLAAQLAACLLLAALVWS